MAASKTRTAGKPIPAEVAVLDVRPQNVVSWDIDSREADMGTLIEGRPVRLEILVCNQGSMPLKAKVTYERAENITIKPQGLSLGPSTGKQAGEGLVVIEFASQQIGAGSLCKVIVEADEPCIENRQIIDVRGDVIEEVKLRVVPSEIQADATPPVGQPLNYTVKVQRDDEFPAEIADCVLEGEEAFTKSLEWERVKPDELSVRIHTANRLAGIHVGKIIIHDRDEYVRPEAIDVRFEILPVDVELENPVIPVVSTSGRGRLECINTGAYPLSVRVLNHVDKTKSDAEIIFSEENDKVYHVAPNTPLEIPFSYRFNQQPTSEVELPVQLWVSGADDNLQVPPQLKMVTVTLSPRDIKPTVDVRIKEVLTPGAKNRVDLIVGNKSDSQLEIEVEGNLPSRFSPHTVQPGKTEERIRGYVIPPPEISGEYIYRLEVKWRTEEAENTEVRSIPINVFPTKKRIPVLLSIIGALSIPLLIAAVFFFSSGQHNETPVQQQPQAVEAPVLDPAPAPSPASSSDAEIISQDMIDAAVDDAIRLRRQGRYREIISLLEPMIDEYEGRLNYDFRTACWIIAGAYAQQGQKAKARRHYRHVLHTDHPYWRKAEVRKWLNQNPTVAD